jgi:hypothetical protein
MRKRLVISTTILVAAGLTFGIYRIALNRTQTFCGFCHRAIHAETEVIAEIDGRRRHACCARCAIAESYQEKKPLHLIAVTDYISGKKLNPQNAYFVDSSRKVLCAHSMAVLGESKQTFQITYDRCFPGTFAFAHLEDADAFARDNGGTVLRLQKLMQEVAQ